MISKTIILSCNIFMNLSPAFSQESSPVFNRLTTLDGLSNNSVNCITQDSSGFIWVGTQDGLNRYDALHFKIYRNDPHNRNTLSNNYITGLAVGKEGLIWIGTDNSLCRLNPVNDSFAIYKNEPGKTGTISNSSWPKPFIDNANDLWIATKSGLDYFDPVTKKFTVYNIAPAEDIKRDPSTNVIEKIIEDKQGRLWCLGIYKLFLFDRASHRFVSSFTINRRANKDIAQKDETHFYLGQFESGLLELDITTSEIRSIPVKDPYNSSISLFNDTTSGNNPLLYIGTTNSGVIRYDPTLKEQEIFQPDIFNDRSISGEYVPAVFRDKQRSLWFATNKGICVLNPQMQLFKNKLLGQDDFPGQFEKFGEISAYYEKSDTQYLGVWPFKGLYKYDHDDKLLQTTGIVSRSSKSSLSKSIFYFLPSNDYLWICTDSGLVRWNERTGQNKVFIPSPGDTSIHREHLRMRKLLPLDNNQFLVRTWNWGILVFDKKENRFIKHYLHKSNDTTSLPSNNIFDIVKLADGNIYVSTANGLCHFLTNEGRFITYKPVPGSGDIVPLKKMDVDANNNLWIASNVGLFFFNTSAKTFEHYTSADGMAINICNRVCIDNKEKIWVTTTVGITRFDPLTKKFLNFSVKEGLPVELYDGVLTRLENGKILAGFNGGYTLIDPENFPFNDQVPTIRISQIKVNDSIYSYELEKSGKVLRLKHWQNFLQVSFAVLNYTNPQQNHFYYKLEGFERNWHESKDGEVIYTNLPYGEYALQVKGSNNSGIMNEAGDTLQITIVPAFWQTWWVKLSAICLAVIAVYIIVKKRISSIRHEADMKHKIAETEMMALRAQMNPHFIFNCLNAIDNLVQTNQKEKATTYLARFAKLIRSVLDSSKNNVVPFQNDYETLQLYLQMEQFRCGNKFTYELRADGELLYSDYKLPPLIIQPFVENAIHHGLLNKQAGDRKLTVSATLENDFIKYAIIDNGVGRRRAQEIRDINKPGYRSYGISTTAERVHLYNQNGRTNDIVITDILENGNPAGTKVEISLKVYENNNHPYA